MTLKDIKIGQKKDHGFTIVELLVVIVVIGILTAITIVSYTGVTTRAKTSASQSNAQSIQSVAEAYNADNGYYPESIAAFSAGTTAKKPAGVSVVTDNAGGTVMTSAISNSGVVVAYSCLTSCTASTGGRIAYWSFSGTTVGIMYIYVGAATSAGTFVAIS